MPNGRLRCPYVTADVRYVRGILALLRRDALPCRNPLGPSDRHLTGLAISAYGLARGRKRYLAALPLIGYGTAWPAHFLIEKNNPATFGHPVWSLRGDAQMIRTMLAGRDAELAETAAKWLAEHGEGERGEGEPSGDGRG